MKDKNYNKIIQEIQIKINNISERLYSPDSFKNLTIRSRANLRARLDNLYEELRFYKNEQNM